MLINITLEAEGFPIKEAHLYFDDERLRLMSNPHNYVIGRIPEIAYSYMETCIKDLKHDGWLQKPLVVEMIDVPEPVLHKGPYKRLDR